MAQSICQHCGQVFTASKKVRKGDETFCNAGCGVRARVPVDAQGNFPVNQHLIAVLSVAFLFFNQVLTASLSALLGHRGRVEISLKLAWISFGLGVLVWLATWVIQKREAVLRVTDVVFAGLTLAMLGAAAWKTAPRMGLALAAVSILLVWNFRGLVFRQRVT